VAFALCGATLSPEQLNWYRVRLGLGGMMTAMPPVTDSLAEGIITWDRLRQSDNLSFYEYSGFLRTRPGWPSEMAMRRAAERSMRADTIAPADIVAYFTRFPPISNAASLRFAEALLATGKVEDARRHARTAWVGGALSPDDESRLLSRFGAVLSLADHDARMDGLLWTNATGTAVRQLQFTSPQRRGLYAARLALKTRAPDASARLLAAWPGWSNDAGLIADRAGWMRDNGDSPGARRLLADANIAPGSAGDPLAWMRVRLQFAQAAANDKQWDLAYRIAARANAYAPGVAVRDQGLAERDVYTSLEWLAGWSAFRYLGRPADAATHFRNYSAAAQTPQTQSKGDYWAGRATSAAGQAAAATAAYEQAGSHPDHFYGQLALERLGRPVAIAPAARIQPDAAARARFEAREPVRAARLLHQIGDRSRQGVFLRALALDLSEPVDQVLLADLGRSLNRPEVAVQVARESRKINGVGMLDAGYPRLQSEAASVRHWTMAHAITRQESMFARDAVSHAGARGLMQLMPGTARETASKLGLGYDMGRLTTDTSYNVLLGSTYFDRMMDYFGGSHVLAVAAYNAGPGNVNKWLRANGDPRMPGVDVVEWIEAIPIFETRNYVQRVLENAVVYDVLNPARARMPNTNRLSAYLNKRTPG
jgi:soluble lytic murein transglycosylase